MHDPHRRIGGVDRLPARPRRPIDIDPQILVVDLHIDLFGLGQHGNRRRGRVDPPARLSHGHALDAVDAALEFEPGEHALALDRRDRFLEATRIGRGGRDQLDPPALRFGIALVHPEQIAREQSRLVAAGAGADLEHRRALVGRVARQQRQRQSAFGIGQGRADRFDLLARHRPHVGVAILLHLRERLELGPQALHRARCARDRLELGIFLGDGDKAIGRQVAGRHLRLQLIAPRLDLRDPCGGDGGHCGLAIPSRPDSSVARK